MKPKFSSRLVLGLSALTFSLAMPPAQAANYYWDIDGATAGAGSTTPNGTWTSGGTTWSTSSNGTAASAAVTTLAADDLFFSAGINATGAYTISLTDAQNAGSLNFQEGTATISGASGVITLGGTGGKITVNNGASATIGGTTDTTIGGSVGLTKRGVGTLTLNGSAVNTFTGGLNVNSGPLVLNFANLATPTDLINSSNALALGGGSFQLTGNSATDSNQSLGNVTVSAGGGLILVNPNGASRTATLTLGSITPSTSTSTLLIGKSSGASGSATITTTSGTLTKGIYGGGMVYLNGTANTGYDWATTVSAGPTFTLSGLSSYTALPTSGGSATTNYRLATGTGTTTLTGGFSVNTLKMAPTGNTSVLALGGNTLILDGGGLLFTGTGTGNAISTGNLTAGAGGSYKLLVHAFNSTNTTISAAITNNGANPVALVVENANASGTAGFLSLTGTNTYTGGIYLNNGAITVPNPGTGTGGYYALNNNNIFASGYSQINNANTTKDASTEIYTGSITLGDGAVLDFRNNTRNFITSGAVTGNGGITLGQAGQGATRLSFNSTANNFTGPIEYRVTPNAGQDGVLTVNSFADSSAAGEGNIRFGLAGTGTNSHIFTYGTGAIVPLILNNRHIELAGTHALTQINNNSPQNFTINTDMLVTANSGMLVTLGGTGISTYAGKIGDNPAGATGATALTAAYAATNTVISLASVSGFSIGATIAGANIPALTTITNINSATKQVTLSNAATGAGVVGQQITITGVTSNVTITKAGTGTWTLSGSNTYNGTTTVSAGTLELSNGAAIADTGAVSLANVATAILKLNSNETIGSLAGGGTTGGNVNLQGNTLSVGSGTFNGSIQGANGALTKTGAGTLTLTGASTYTGATSVSGGQLTVSGTGTLAGTSGLSVSGGATFNYLPTTVGSTLTLGTDSTLNLADGSTLGLTWNASTASNLVALGVATIGAGAGVALNMTGTYAPDTTYTILTAASGLDTGTYVFLNPIDYTAVVAKLSGSVSITPSAATALTAAYWTGTATAGVTKVWAASDGSASNWASSDGGAAQALVPGSGADVIISSSTVAVAPTATTLGANMTIGSLTISDATNGLSLDVDPNTLTITPLVATAGIVMNASVPASTIAAKVALGAAQTWTNDSANSLTVSGGVSGGFALTKAGTGLVTLSGVNSYTGSTTINDNSGTLDISGAGSLGSGTYAQPIAIGTDSTLKFSNSVSGATQTLSGAVTGLGGLTLAPSVNRSFLVLSNAGNAYSGVTSISAGRLQASPGAGLSPNTSFVITGNATSGGQLFFGAGGTVSNNFSIAGVGTVEIDALSTKVGAVRFQTTGSNLSGTVTLSGDARVGNINGTGSATISGQITGSAGIEFYGATNTASVTHSYILSNLGTANDYTGDTTITAADFSSVRTGGRSILSLGANEQIPHGAGKGIVVFSGADADHISTLDLNGFSETINGVSNVSAAGANIRNNAAVASVLTIGDNDTTSSFSGVISNATGTLSITKIGTGTLTLSGANTFTGATTNSAGFLSLENNLALQSSPLDTLASIAGDATNGLKTTMTALTFGGLTGDKNLAAVFTTASGGYSGVTALTLNPGTSATPSYTGDIVDGAVGMTLTKSGVGLQTLDGVLSHTGGVGVTAGTLTLGNAGNSYTGTTLLSATFAAGAGILVTANGALGAIGAGNGTTIIGVPVSGVTTSQLGFSGSINYSMAEKITGSGVGGAANVGPFIGTQRGFIQSVSGNNTFAGDIELSGNGVSRIGTQDGAQLTLTGAITQGTGITTASILFRAGNLNGDFVTLSGTDNSFGGDSTVFTSLATAGEYSGLRIGIDNAHPTNLTVQNFSSASGSSTALDLNGNDQALNGLASGGAGTLNMINLDTVNASTLTLNPTADKNSGANIVILGGSPGGTPLGVINLVKVGAFTQTLNGVNTYTGTTTVNAGTLTLGNASALGTSPATVTGGSLNLNGQVTTNTVSVGTLGTLTGSGTTGAATLAGSVTPGGTGSGLITVASATVASTSSMTLQLPATGTRGTNYDALTVSGLLSLDGTVTIDITGLTPTIGQTFDLIDSTGPIDVTNFTVATDLILPALGGGLAWDTSLFASTGVVSIINGDPYTPWATLKGLTVANNAKNADPDGDGKNNLYEFAFDGDPLSGANDGKIVGKIGTVGGNQVMTLTLPVRNTATFSANSGDQVSALIDGLYYKIEGDVDLGTFANTISEVTGGDATAIQTGLPSLSTGWTYRTFRDAGTVPTVPKAFLRARISDTP